MLREESYATAEITGRPLSAVLVTPSANALVVQGKSLQFPQHLSFKGWLRIGLNLSSMATTTAWCLGDWLNYGESHFTGRYREAIEQTSLDYQTLRNYAWVTRRFTVSRRRDSLSFGHHAEVAALPEPEQDYWLRKSEELSWSRNRLRAKVRESVAERRVDSDGRSRPGHSVDLGTSNDARSSDLTLEVCISAEYLTVCEEAAQVSGLSLHEWARRALEQVALRVLNRDNQPDGRS